MTYAHTTIGAIDADTNAALTLGGGVNYFNAGTVTDTGFIRVGDIGNNAILSPLGTYGVGQGTLFNFGQLIKSGGTGVSYETADTYNAGTIEAASGTLDFTGAIRDTSATGSGTTGTTGVLKIDAGATLDTNGIGAGESVVFNGAGTLMLNAAAAPVAAIAGLVAGVKFDLTGVAGATASINGKTLLITPLGARRCRSSRRRRSRA